MAFGMHPEVITMRRTRFLTMAQLQRIALSKTVPCRYKPCSAPSGQRCTNTSSTTSKGAPLGGLGAHLCRLTDAEDARYGRRPAPSREPVPA